MTHWRINEYPKYAAFIADAETEYNIPRDLLARLLYQSSRFAADVINGEKRNPIGAIGIAQMMPDVASQLLVDRYDPFKAIIGAARHLKRMYERFGNWRNAILAYRCGADQVKQGKTPKDAREYLEQIITDVPV